MLSGNAVVFKAALESNQPWRHNKKALVRLSRVKIRLRRLLIYACFTAFVNGSKGGDLNVEISQGIFAGHLGAVDHSLLDDRTYLS